MGSQTPLPSIFSLYFFPNSPLLTTFFWKYRPNKIWVKHKNNLMRDFISLFFHVKKTTKQHYVF